MLSHFGENPNLKKFAYLKRKVWSNFNAICFFELIVPRVPLICFKNFLNLLRFQWVLWVQTNLSSWRNDAVMATLYIYLHLWNRGRWSWADCLVQTTQFLTFEWMSDCWLTNTKWATFKLSHGKSKFHFRFVLGQHFFIYIVLAQPHWNYWLG